MRVLLEDLIVPWLVNKCPVLYAPKMSIASYTVAYHVSVS